MLVGLLLACCTAAWCYDWPAPMLLTSLCWLHAGAAAADAAAAAAAAPATAACEPPSLYATKWPASFCLQKLYSAGFMASPLHSILLQHGAPFAVPAQADAAWCVHAAAAAATTTTAAADGSWSEWSWLGSYRLTFSQHAYALPPLTVHDCQGFHGCACQAGSTSSIKAHLPDF